MRQRIHNVCCSNSVQSRSLMVYLVNTNLTSFVVLVNWHTHYVVNNELICSICTMFLCFMLDFISCVCLFLLFNGRELAFTFANCRRNSVCRLSSVVCRLSSVCDVGAPYSAGWNFRQFFHHTISQGLYFSGAKKSLVRDAPFPLKFSFKVTDPPFK